MLVNTLVRRRRSRRLPLVITTAVVVGLIAPAGSAAASPAASTPPLSTPAHAVPAVVTAATGTAASTALQLVAAAAPADPEGGDATLRKQLDAASKGFLEARTALTKSQRRQKELNAELKKIEADMAVHTESLGTVVGVAYRTGRLGPMSALLTAESPDGFLDRASALNTVAANEDRALRDLLQSKESATRSRLAVDKEVRDQEKLVALMAKRKDQAERALKAAAVGGQQTAGPGGSARGSAAAPARRNADGSLPGESCSIDDPTTTGCLTPRTLHAMNQAKAAGFTRFVSCFRTGDNGEHPQGRACDFAAQPSGFGGVATGGDRTYGNNLAEYFVNNADRLGVLYVIWFRQIWLPSSGWRAYNNGAGDPSSDHTNHVHLSVV